MSGQPRATNSASHGAPISMNAPRTCRSRDATGTHAAATSASAANRSNRPIAPHAAHTAIAASVHAIVGADHRAITAYDHPHAANNATTMIVVSAARTGEAVRSKRPGGVTVKRASFHASRPFHNG